MSNGDWLHQAIERIEERLEGIERRLATHEGQHQGADVEARNGISQWQVALGALGILMSLGIGLAGLFLR